MNMIAWSARFVGKFMLDFVVVPSEREGEELFDPGRGPSLNVKVTDGDPSAHYNIGVVLWQWYCKLHNAKPSHLHSVLVLRSTCLA